MNPESYVFFREHVRTAEPGDVTESLVIHLHRDGSPFHAEVRRSAINYRGRPYVLNIIRDAHAGRTPLSPEAAQALVETTNQPPPPGVDLTGREREVLALMLRD